jgi:uncharacterized phage-associated protein
MRFFSINADTAHTLSVGRAVFDAVRRRGETLDVLKLEKLIYLSHGWSLACTGLPLVSEDFHVGEFGPSLFGMTPLRRRYGTDPLPFDESDRIFGGGCVPYGDDPKRFEVIARVVDRYGCYVNWRLSAITRMDDGAYQRALSAGESVVRDSEIREDFVRLGKAGRETTVA